MMRPLASARFHVGVLLCLLALSPVAEVGAHGDQDWNEFTIDNKNDQVDRAIEQLKNAIADVILERRKISAWPDPQLQRLRNELMHTQEELQDMLNHFGEDGIRIQLTSALRENPQAGRAVAGSHAIETGIELLERMAASDGVAAVEQEFHTDGIAALLFDLMSVYADNMRLYEALAEKAD